MKKSDKPIITGKSLPQNKNLPVYFDYSAFKEKHYRKLFYVSIVLAVILLISLFKNISYPLFWADESMTAIGAERVLKFGYPKVHDGKNVFYDLLYTNTTLGINKKDDAFIGGSNWGHYYFGVIGYKLAELTDDFYGKSGIFRSTFTIMGVLGLAILCYFLCGFFTDKCSKYGFACLFLLFEISSIPLALHLRQLRYYSLAIFLILLIISLYSRYRFLKPYNKALYISVLSLALWLLFNTFSPSYYATIITIIFSEVGIASRLLFKTRNLRNAILSSLLPLSPVLISFAGIVPLFSYFNTFQISKALSEYTGYNTDMYLQHIFSILRYFRWFDYLYLAIVLKAAILFFFKKLQPGDLPLVKTSIFLALFFIVFILTIARIPVFMYTRYRIYLQPVLSAMIIIDFFILLNVFSTKSRTLLNSYSASLIAVFAGLFIYTLSDNFSYLTGHLYEITHPYKGALDYNIPYIKTHFPRSDTLIIATNYEETSYMYYLKSKVTIGFVGNNIKEDSMIQPQIVCYNRHWITDYCKLINKLLNLASYERIRFPINDVGENNNPDLNRYLTFHLFKTYYDTVIKHQVNLFILNKKQAVTYADSLTAGYALLQKGKLDSARSIFLKIEQETREKPAPLLHDYLGLLFLKENKPKDAEREFRKEISLNLKKDEAYFQLGMMNLQNNAADKAIVNFDSTIALNPTYADAYNNLGACYKLFKHDNKKTRAFFVRSVEVNPDFLRGYINILICAMNDKDMDSSIKYTRILLNKGMSVDEIKAEGVTIPDEIMRKINAR